MRVCACVIANVNVGDGVGVGVCAHVGANAHLGAKQILSVGVVRVGVQLCV